MKNSYILFFLIIVQFFALTVKAGAELYVSARGYSIDLPEAYIYVDGDSKSRFVFSFEDGIASLELAIYPANRFDTALSGAKDTAKRIGAKADYTSFDYCGYDASLAELNFSAGGKAHKGWGLFINNASSTGPKARVDADCYDLVLLSYTAFFQNSLVWDIVSSAMDGFSMGHEGRLAPGPIGAVARNNPEKRQETEAVINFGKVAFKARWDKREAGLCQSLVEREYRVLSSYASAPDFIEAAIARFYRMILKDAAPALDELALLMSMAWEKEAASYGSLQGLNIANPVNKLPNIEERAETPGYGAAGNARTYAEALLKWVQTFAYERNFEGSDVVNPISAAFEGRGDCDSRVLVMVLLLRQENIESILMYSLKHEHAMIALDVPGAGARYPYRQKGWLVAETTRKIGIGLIDSEMADPADWFAVSFQY